MGHRRVRGERRLSEPCQEKVDLMCTELRDSNRTETVALFFLLRASAAPTVTDLPYGICLGRIVVRCFSSRHRLASLVLLSLAEP